MCSTSQFCLRDRLHLTAQFPCSTVLVRNPTGAAVRSAYLTNELVKTIAQNNDYTKIRLTAAGTKILVKQEAGRGYDAQFRILGEGLPVVLPFLEPDSIATTELATLRTLLSSYYVRSSVLVCSLSRLNIDSRCSRRSRKGFKIFSPANVCYLAVFFVSIINSHYSQRQSDHSHPQRGIFRSKVRVLFLILVEC